MPEKISRFVFNCCVELDLIPSEAEKMHEEFGEVVIRALEEHYGKCMYVRDCKTGRFRKSPVKPESGGGQA